MKYKVLMLKNLAETGKKYLRDHDCEVIVTKGNCENDYVKDMKDVDALFVRNEKITADMMDQAPKLKVIAKHGIGYDNIDVEAATERNIQVVYAPKGNVNSVAEHALLLILASARRLGVVSSEIKNNNYAIRYVLDDAYDVQGKTIGLIGCGNIARELAKKAMNGFGMKVIAYDPYVKEAVTTEGITIVKDRDLVFQQADFISVHMPSTNETRHSIGMNEFKLMKKTSYIVNTARGDIICEDDLIEALKLGIIHGAALDVYENEPIDSSNELLHMNNVITTPHTAGMTVEASDRLSLMGAQGIVQSLYNEPITWPVNHINA